MINHISFSKLGIELDINRVLFSLFGVDIYTYGVLIALGLLLAYFYASREAKRVGINQDDFLNMFIIGVPVAIVCARLYYVAFNWESYKDNLLEIFNIRGGGIAIYGGVIGAALSVILYCKKKEISVGKVLDVLSIGLLIGQAIGRWGNFVNGEAFGGPTDLPWAMSISKQGISVADMVHPTFLYESLWNALGIIVLLLFKRIKKADGELFCGYMVWYGLGRMAIEGLRTDSLYIGSLRVSQILAVLSVISGVIIFCYLRKENKIKSKDDNEIEC